MHVLSRQSGFSVAPTTSSVRDCSSALCHILRSSGSPRPLPFPHPPSRPPLSSTHQHPEGSRRRACENSPSGPAPDGNGRAATTRRTANSRRCSRVSAYHLLSFHSFCCLKHTTVPNWAWSGYGFVMVCPFLDVRVERRFVKPSWLSRGHP